MGALPGITNKALATRLRLLEAARRCFAERGYEATTMRDIASEAGASLGLSYRYFPHKSGFALAIYADLATRVETLVPDLDRGPIAARFVEVMERKLDWLDAQRDVLLAIMPHALQPGAHEGVLAESTQVIRARVSGAFRAVAAGATNAPAPNRLERAARSLYALHLFLILLWTQNPDSAREVLALAGEWMGRLRLLSRLPGIDALSHRTDSILQRLLGKTASPSIEKTAELIADILLQRRRALDDDDAADPSCFLMPRIREHIERGAPIHLVLPAFPAKAPNETKVLGTLPDLGEAVALRSLSQMCDEIADVYEPGARLTLCSDGHVFADVVGVADRDVTRYRRGIEQLLVGDGIEHIRVFDLRDVFPKTTAAQARTLLLENYAEEPAELRALVQSSRSLTALLNGLHRFLSEDAFVRFPDLSRTKARERTKTDALEVLRRSRAWGRAVEHCFPSAIRLSIHPQPALSPKLGVHLIPTADAWLTPWHGVAVLRRDGGLELMKRSDAEAVGAFVIEENGRPSHMEL